MGLLKIDATTMAASRGRFSRICIELDLTKPLVPMVTLGGFAQAIKYEGLHQICYDYDKYDKPLLIIAL